MINPPHVAKLPDQHTAHTRTEHVVTPYCIGQHSSVAAQTIEPHWPNQTAVTRRVQGAIFLLRASILATSRPCVLVGSQARAHLKGNWHMRCESLALHSLYWQSARNSGSPGSSPTHGRLSSPGSGSLPSPETALHLASREGSSRSPARSAAPTGEKLQMGRGESGWVLLLQHPTRHLSR